MRNILFISILLLLSNILFAQTVQKDSIRLIFPDSAVFKGFKTIQNSDTLYVGSYYSLDFNQVNGCFDSNFNIQNALITNGIGDSIFINRMELADETRREAFNKSNFLIDDVEATNVISQKIYDPQKRKWIIIRKLVDDADYINGTIYDSHSFCNIKNDTFTEIVMRHLVMFCLLIVGLFFIFGGLSSLFNRRITGWIVISMCVLIIILYYGFLDEYQQKQIVLPIFTLLIPFIVCRYIKRQKIREITHGMMCVGLIVGWGYYQMYKLEETVSLCDGTKVDLHWRKGTDLIKRLYVKSIINDLQPVKVSDHGQTYILYISQCEVAESQIDLLNDEIFSWFIFNHDPLANYSYRESQLALNLLEKISGINFDFLSYNEWLCAAQNRDHDAHVYDNIHDVNEGEMNVFGLKNIAGNVPEYTSTYIKQSRIGLATDTILTAYEHIVVSGNAYISNDSVNFSVVDKDLKMGGVGFRFIYRPNDIGRRMFLIKGILRNDRSRVNFPKQILLISLNGHLINHFSNYESFQEKLIESRYMEKNIEVLDVDTNKKLLLTMPAGYEEYDFIPLFYFKK